MEIQILEHDFTVSKIENIWQIDFTQEYIFISKTPDEISLVCESANTPANTIASEPGWKALKISGILDFGMVGVIAKISNILAAEGISIFVVSTYNTDYIFLKSNTFEKGIQLLGRHGYNVTQTTINAL